jgi:branched-chain amino acid transport system substrate-binding protein
LAALSVLIVVLAFSQAARAQDAYDIWAILPLTGPNAYFGKEAHDALGVMEKAVNRAGGIRGRSVHFQTLDSQSSPQVALQLLNTIKSKNVPIVIGDGSVANCSVMQAVLKDTGPVQFCLSPGITPGGYTYAIGPAPADELVYAIRYFRNHGVRKIGLLLATDATGQVEGALMKSTLARPENRDVSIVADERFNPTDLSVSAQLTTIKSSGAQLLFSFTSGTPFGTVLRGYQDVGLKMPVLTSNGNLGFAAMTAFGDLVPEGGLYFHSAPIPPPGATVANGPCKAIQEAYLKDFAESGIQPDNPAAIMWDTVSVAIAALRTAGVDASPDRIRAYINGLHDFPSVQGVIDFRKGDMRGQNDVRIIHWARGAAAWTILPNS